MHSLGTKKLEYLVSKFQVQSPRSKTSPALTNQDNLAVQLELTRSCLHQGFNNEAECGQLRPKKEDWIRIVTFVVPLEAFTRSSRLINKSQFPLHSWRQYAKHVSVSLPHHHLKFSIEQKCHLLAQKVQQLQTAQTVIYACT